MNWVERWKARHSVTGKTPISDLSETAKGELLYGLEEIEASEGDVEAMVRLGELCLHRGEVGEAIGRYTKAAEGGRRKR